MKAFVVEVRKNLLFQVIALLVGAVIFGISSVVRADAELLSGVQAGEIQLQCEFKDGTRVVDPSKVVGFDPDNRHWEFSNGGARSCVTLRK